MRYLVVLATILLPALSYADVKFHEEYDDFTDDKLVMTMGNLVDNEDNELVSLEYTGALSKEGVAQDFALIATYIGEEWVHLKSIRLRGDDTEAHTLVCNHKSHKVREDGLLMEQCLVAIDLDVLKDLSQAKVIKVGVGGIVGSTNPEVLRDFLKKLGQ